MIILKKHKTQFSLTKDETDMADLAIRQAANHSTPLALESLEKNLLSFVKDEKKEGIVRLAFEEDPHNPQVEQYKRKPRLVPDTLAKQIAIRDDLVATLVRAKQQYLGQFGQPRRDRHSLGFEAKTKTGVTKDLDVEQIKALDKRIDKLVDDLWHCGPVHNVKNSGKCTFSEYLELITRNIMVNGRISTEILRNRFNGQFQAFRAVDASTIFKAVDEQKRTQDFANEIRQKLQENVPTPPAQEIEWIQVIDGTKEVGFTSDEMKCYNFFPVPDIEMNGYPVTPIDTVISAITTHINITTHNRLYFENGRATRGMLVIRGEEELSKQTLNNIKHQFNTNINAVGKSWRMPIFGVGPGGDVEYKSIDTGGRDMEFQYLTDMNARVIFSAFFTSPDELPGWSYLSKGVNSQAISESNSEWTLTAARDIGLRPIIAKLENFINSELLPELAPDIAHLVEIRLKGLEAEDAEKEAVRLQQDMGVHMTYNDILEKVEKEKIDKSVGGELPLNKTFLDAIYPHLSVGEIEEYFLGRKGAKEDPSLQYRRDQYWFQWQQMIMGAPGGGQESDGLDEAANADANRHAAMSEAKAGHEGGEFNDDKSEVIKNFQIAHEYLTKSVSKKLPTQHKKVLQKENKIIDKVVEGWNKDLEEFSELVKEITEKHI